MIRGTLYATVGIVIVTTRDAWHDPLTWAVLALMTWPWTLLTAGPLIVLSTLPLMMIQDSLRRRVTGRLRRFCAVLAGIPFGILVTYLVLAFFGKRGTPWTDAAWIPWMPESVAAGLGLGLGCVEGLPTETGGIQ